MTRDLDLCPGWAERRLRLGEVEIFLRTAGAGHGYPQTQVGWHKIAPELARHCTLVVADLRGYGASSPPRDELGPMRYAKPRMAPDCLALRRALCHKRFMVGEHDRGGRVAYRLAREHPEAVIALLAVDILPTAEVWRRFSVESALAQYRALLQDPSRVHAICEDYRAGAGIDRQLDAADWQNGRKITCPTLVVWGGDYLGKRGADPVQVWDGWCSARAGAEIDSGHFLAAENPEATVAAMLPFLAAHGGR